MSNIVHFVPKVGVSAKDNLAEFIECCRSQLTVFGDTLPFDSNVWDVSSTIELKATTHRTRLKFSTMDSSSRSEWVPMASPFLSFAKAYLRYRQALSPVKGFGERLGALRVLDYVLQGLHPSELNGEHLNRAVNVLRERYSPAMAYNTSRQLETIVGFMADHQLLHHAFIWRTPLVSRLDKRVRVGAEFDRHRIEKMPSPAAFNALGTIFSMASEPVDVLVSSVAALLCAAPNRINEILLLPEQCEVTGSDTSGQSIYGLRWWPAKGSEPMIKWVLPSMTDVVKDAIAKLRALSAPGRKIAAWYEAHPGQLYLPESLEHLRHREWLTLAELAEVLSEESAFKPHQFCTSYKVPTELRKSSDQNNLTSHVQFKDIEQTLLSLLPTGFPWVNKELRLRFSQALFVLNRNQLTPHKSTYRSIIHPVMHGDIGSRFGRILNRSIFEKFGFREDDGSPIQLHTHQFRHYLNTLAQMSGLSQMDIAKWSGRKDVRQNSAYDHLSDRDVMALARETARTSQKGFSVLGRIRPDTLIRRDEFARLKVPTAHTTEYGYCIHDFAMLPCHLHQDCLNCDEQICVKGDEAETQALRRFRDETRRLLAEATLAEADCEYGANKWVAYQRRTLARIDQLCAILEDPNVPVGAVIMSAAVAPASRLEQALEQRKNLSETKPERD
ncbi:integrase [Acidithiobacillus montserratensis]|uniref:Integrase n=1 Tax=Acidithiobacillus montserratensis TaxID=2729135 RepID=A0ACD5HET3_9PROT|nr:hypothetical protein [Acidithiobacillus montserratensis]MBN2680048.1 hypothetical protein [Acidithiobacillaceae bacterium]MBU2749071.1 integrase [Acidithiobacillus montserratensis]